MKKFQIFNLNISIAIVEAYTAEEAVSKYCNARSIYDTAYYRAVETTSDIF